MTTEQCNQVARIIEEVFDHEEQIDPRTIALMFTKLGQLIRYHQNYGKEDND